MREWTRARRIRECGGCGSAIAIGAPIVEYRFPQVRRVLARCEPCEGTAPPDLAPLPERCEHAFAGSSTCVKCGWAPPAFIQRAVQPLAGLPLDWKSQSSGERVPGEEG